MIDTHVVSPLLALGAILLVGALLGDAAERLRIPWITGCILAGVALGPEAADFLRRSDLATLDGFTQASLAVIAFNIGCQLSLPRLKAVGSSTAVLALVQLVAPLALVLAAEPLVGMALPAAILVAGVAPATAPTTTYAVIRRREATGIFVDRALGILAINDAATVLIFSVVSAVTVSLLGAQSSGAAIGASLSHAALNEGLSVVVGAAIGLVYLFVRRIVEDGTPGWQARLTATLLGLVLAGIGAAIALHLSHLLVPLSIGIVIANGTNDAERQRTQNLIHGFEEPLFIVFFVLAGAHHAAVRRGACRHPAGRLRLSGGPLHRQIRRHLPYRPPPCGWRPRRAAISGCAFPRRAVSPSASCWP